MAYANKNTTRRPKVRSEIPDSQYFHRTSDHPQFTVVSNGTFHNFVPFFQTVDPSTNSRRELIDIHKDYVRVMADPENVYILDQNGNRVDVNS